MTMEVTKKSKKAGGVNKQLDFTNLLLKKILTGAIFLLAPAADMLGTYRFPMGCKIWQQAVILESTCETNLIIIFLPAYRTGLFTPLTTCSPLVFFFSFLFGQIIRSPAPFHLFTLRTNYSMSISSFRFAFPEVKILSPTPILQKYSKSNFLSDLIKIPLSTYPFHILASGV